MSFSEIVRIGLLLGALFLPLVVWARNRKTHLYSLPPGPKPFPVIGNVLDIPTERPWLKYTEWGRVYGAVTHMTAFGQSIIVLNSPKAIFDLLERKGGIYSDRPRIVMAGELVGWDNSPFLGSNGPRHKEYRRLFAEVMSPRNAEEWHPLQQKRVVQLAAQILESPEAFRSHIETFTRRLVLEISHGHIVKDDKDSFSAIATQVTNEFSELLVPGTFLVDVLPILRYVPLWTGATFQKKAKQYRESLYSALEWPYQRVKDQIADGTALPSFAATLIGRKENPTEDDEFNWKWATFGVGVAGSDTTSGALTSFILAMSLYPDVQRKAQAEIDAVVGNQRLPTFQDRAELPYIEGLVKEVLRWNPVAPIANPHRLTMEADDVYREWRIPRGSMVIANSWGVMHDPKVYPDPFEFNPERYYKLKDTNGDSHSEQASGPDQVVINPDPKKFAFGYGRRICPGLVLADGTVYIGIVTMLALFDIGPLTSGDPPQYGPGLISHPGHFTCAMKPRNDEARNLINKYAEGIDQ